MANPTILKGRTWVDGETVTPSRLNDHVDLATLRTTQTDVLVGRATSGAGAAEEIACTAAGRALLDDANAAAQRTTLGLGTLATQDKTAVDITGGAVAPDNYHANNDALTYGASVAVDFSVAAKTVQTITLTGDLTLTSANLDSGRAKYLRLIGDSSSRSLVFPAGWRWLGWVAPTSLAAGKVALLGLLAFGASDSDVVASYSAEI
jgi:hypothetical protein